MRNCIGCGHAPHAIGNCSEDACDCICDWESAPPADAPRFEDEPHLNTSADVLRDEYRERLLTDKGKALTAGASAQAEQRCPACGYTEQDAQLQMDHRLCRNYGKAPWEQRQSAPVPAAAPAGGAREPIVEKYPPERWVLETQRDPVTEQNEILLVCWSGREKLEIASLCNWNERGSDVIFADTILRLRDAAERERPLRQQRIDELTCICNWLGLRGDEIPAIPNGFFGEAIAKAIMRKWSAEKETLRAERDDAVVGRNLRQGHFNRMGDLADEAIEQRDALRAELERFTALERHLPAGYAIGDDATAELAVKLTATESALEQARREREEARLECNKVVGQLTEIQGGDGFLCGTLHGKGTFVGGCGKHVVFAEAYRCADCTASFHRECINKHFKLDSYEQGAIGKLREAVERLYRGAKGYMAGKPWRCADEDLALAEAALAETGEPQ